MVATSLWNLVSRRGTEVVDVASIRRRYGYLVTPRPGTTGCGEREGAKYSGVSQAEVWPGVDDAYWTSPEQLPSDVKFAYEEIWQDPTDFLFLRVTRSARALSRLAAFIEASGRVFGVLAVEVETDEHLPPCDDLSVKWFGFEPYARGEWGLLSVLDSSKALASWAGRINEHGLLSSPESCLAFAADYRKAMGRPGGPEPIADDAPIDILRVGHVPNPHVTKPG